MNAPVAIVIGATAIAAAVLAAPWVAPKPPAGRYQWVAEGGRLWRGDTATGAIRSCEKQMAEDITYRPGECVAIFWWEAAEPPRKPPRRPAPGG